MTRKPLDISTMPDNEILKRAKTEFYLIPDHNGSDRYNFEITHFAQAKHHTLVTHTARVHMPKDIAKQTAKESAVAIARNILTEALSKRRAWYTEYNQNRRIKI